jgi:uncharacterized protein (UPF0276 family)
LLDLHNLYVGQQNGILSPWDYLEQVDPLSVEEVHIAGGDELAGFYTDSHSGPTPDEVWEWAYSFGSRLTNLRAIVFEFHESYFAKLTLRGIVRELERMNEWADSLSIPRLQLHAS